LGFKAVLSNKPEEIKAADKVIFQEWGSKFDENALESGLDSLIPTLKQPVLGFV
jgi:glutamine amidotransferase